MATAEGRTRDLEAFARLGVGPVARQRAIAQLYQRYGKPFCRYFRRHGLSAEAAEDVMQETFVRVLRSFESFRGEGSLEAWLWTIARNTLMSHMRSVSPTMSLDDQDPDTLDVRGSAFAGAPSRPAQADCVRRGFERYQRVAPDCADAITRVVVDGWTYDDLAQWRQSSNGATREYLSQCRKRLAELMQPCFDAQTTG
jgi:RNA polymerase sigma factor (sigma-70 family)